MRKGCIELIHMLKALPHTEQVTLTTNGILLAVYAKELKEAGLDGVNVSLDTLCAEKFAEITGYDRLKDVLEGIRTAHALGLKVKINTVLQRASMRENGKRCSRLQRKHRSIYGLLR